MTLRSDYEPGTSRWATRRAMWLALGLSDADMVKPKIAIVNTSSQLAICFSHLDEIAKRAKRAIEAAGGQLDGMICLASCDKTGPGQLMAAARLNIPTIMVACGYQASGSFRGRHCDIEDVFLAAGHVASGSLSAADLTEMSGCAVLSPGVCAGFGTANTMHLACEALGMALPGSTPVRANSEPMWRTVDDAGRRIVEIVGEDLRPRDVMTPAAFRNAVTSVLSVSGSINSVKHLQAVAAETENGTDVYGLFETLADGVPLLAEIQPNGETPIEEFEDAGGTAALTKQLEPQLDGSPGMGMASAGLRAGRQGPHRPGRRGHRRAAVRPGEQGHRGRRDIAGGGGGRPARAGPRRRHDSHRRPGPHRRPGRPGR
ncbi:MAG TPA: dihydroxy-acid dehydratase [Trebonia sp.]